MGWRPRPRHAGVAVASNAFAENQDSAGLVYLTFGGVSLLLAATLAAAGVLVVAPRIATRGRWVALAAAFVAAALVPYVPLIGWPGFAIHAVLAAAAIATVVVLLRDGAQRGSPAPDSS